MGQVTAGRAAGYGVAKFAVRADCGPSYSEAGRAVVQRDDQYAGRGGLTCNLWGGLRAQSSSPRRSLMCTNLMWVRMG